MLHYNLFVLFVLIKMKYIVALLINNKFFFAATSSLLPYLTIHMQSIGLTIEEIAIIYLALPFTTFLSPPITGKIIILVYLHSF